MNILIVSKQASNEKKNEISFLLFEREREKELPI